MAPWELPQAECAGPREMKARCGGSLKRGGVSASMGGRGQVGLLGGGSTTELGLGG